MAPQEKSCKNPNGTKTIIKMRRVIYYLKKNPDQGIKMRKDNNLQLIVLYDLDWVACYKTRYMTHYHVFL